MKSPAPLGRAEALQQMVEREKVRLRQEESAEVERDMAELARLAAKYDIELVFPGVEHSHSSSASIEQPAAIPRAAQSTLTIAQLTNAFHTDPDSNWHDLSYAARYRSEQNQNRLVEAFGNIRLSDIDGRTLKSWHEKYSDGGRKLAMGYAMMTTLRSLFSFGTNMLSDPEAARLSSVMRTMRFKNPKKKPAVRLSLEQAYLIIMQAHVMKFPSIALAQALQSETPLLQKDIIGEWIPEAEPGDSEIQDGKGWKWVRGLRWEEIDEQLVLRRAGGKGASKQIEVDLGTRVMVMGELLKLAPGLISTGGQLHRDTLPEEGPVIICDYSRHRFPWIAGEFRRKWRVIARAAEIPDNVRNADSGDDDEDEDT